MTRYLAAFAWYQGAWWLALLTRGPEGIAPEYLLRAYNAQARAWNRMQARRAA